MKVSNSSYNISEAFQKVLKRNWVQFFSLNANSLHGRMSEKEFIHEIAGGKLLHAIGYIRIFG